MKILSKNILFVFLLVLLVTVIIYWPLYFTFYQQDEWQGVGYMLVLGFKGYTTSGFSPIQVFFGQSRIFTAILNYILFQMFPYNISLLATYAILVHTVNATLVYVLSFRLFKKVSIAVITALFFCLNAVGNQAIIWFGTSVATLTAATFILISLLFLLKYIEKQKNTFLWYSYIALLISIYFKESGLGFIPFYTLILFLTNKNKIRMKFVLKATLPIIFFLSFVIFRFVSTIFSYKAVGYISSSSHLTNSIPVNFIRAVFTIFGQILIPQNVALIMGDKIIPHLIPTLTGKELQIQTLGIDILMIIITCAILIVLFFLNRKQKTFRKFILLILLVIATILPYVLVAPGWSYFESRYYYVPVIGVSLLIGNFFLAIWKNKKLSVSFLVLLIILLGTHVLKTYTDLFAQKQLAQQRLSVLHSIKQTVPVLNKKTVFYITSNQTYTVPNNPLPMQQGIGYTLQVWLYNKNNEKLKPQLLLPYTFLWDLGSQGYKQIGDQGFGYFYDLNDMKKTIRKYKIEQKNVYAFYWDGNTNHLSNITKKIREALSQ